MNLQVLFFLLMLLLILVLLLLHTATAATATANASATTTMTSDYRYVYGTLLTRRRLPLTCTLSLQQYQCGIFREVDASGANIIQ